MEISSQNVCEKLSTLSCLDVWLVITKFLNRSCPEVACSKQVSRVSLMVQAQFVLCFSFSGTDYQNAQSNIPGFAPQTFYPSCQDQTSALCCKAFSFN